MEEDFTPEPDGLLGKDDTGTMSASDRKSPLRVNDLALIRDTLWGQHVRR